VHAFTPDAVRALDADDAALRVQALERAAAMPLPRLRCLPTFSRQDVTSTHSHRILPLRRAHLPHQSSNTTFLA